MWEERTKEPYTLRERKLEGKVKELFPNVISLDRNRPDYYDSISKVFIEVKIVTPFQFERWVEKGLFPKNVERQLSRYPQPLIILFFDYEGNFLGELKWEFSLIQTKYGVFIKKIENKITDRTEPQGCKK